MLTRMRSATSSTNRPAEVVRVTRPDQSLKRAASPGPFPHSRVLTTWSVAFCLPGIVEGVTVVGPLSANPTSEGLPGEDTIVTRLVAELMVTGSPPRLLASTRIVKGRAWFTESFGQSSAGVQ